MRYIYLRLYLILLSFLIPSFSGTGVSIAAPLSQSPEESITYWKPFEISSEEDGRVKAAHEIFTRLLTGWEETRLYPKLYVVHSDAGPWAASLDDGSILLSREAIDICLRVEGVGGRDRLAFVLGHELSHQKADHLWHRRFFRLANQQPPQVRGHMLSDIPVNQLEVADLEAKETQADRDGLLLMAMTGFDPYHVAGAESKFFTEWVESLWGQPCGKKSDPDACAKAVNRADRIRTYLQQIADQTILFELGIQAFVSGRFADARTFFTAFGREFPGTEVHNNIGLTYIGEAMKIRDELLSKGEELSPGFMFRYPLFLDDDAGIKKENVRRGSTRGGSIDPKILKQRQEMERLLNDAVQSFERAIKLDPSNRSSYYNLATAYLLLDNAPSAYGLIAGNYVKRFGQDAMVSMLLGISAYLDSEDAEHSVKVRQLLEKAVDEGGNELAPFTRANLAAFFAATGDPATGDPTTGEEAAQSQWKMLADLGRKNGDEGLFRFALKQMGRQVQTATINADKKDSTETIHGFILSKRITTVPQGALQKSGTELWIEGERLQIYRFPDGSQIVLDSNRSITALWQGEGEAVSAKGIHIGNDMAGLNRAYGSYGKKVSTAQGEYQVFETAGIAFRIRDGKVAGWFLIH